MIGFLIGITSLFLGIAKAILMYIIGDAMSYPEQLRIFLGLNQIGENADDFYTITNLVKQLGTVIKAIAIFLGISTFVTTITMIFS